MLCMSYINLILSPPPLILIDQHTDPFGTNCAVN